MQKAIDPSISTWPEENPQLVGSQCGDCGATTFPVQQRCPRCSGGQMSESLLPRRGTLVAWTTQGFPPGAPYAGTTGKDFVPFGVGFIELPEGRIEARLAGDVDQELRIGMPMELTVVPFTTDEDGTEVLTFAFRPTGEG